MNIKVYEVGGSIRDSFLGLKSKDRDFCVIAPSVEDMREYVISQGGKIYPTKKQKFGVIRCKLEPYGNADFAIGRTDGLYSDHRHPDSIKIASCIEEDLARRDFTVCAMAKDSDGNIIDLFGGREDIENRILRCVGVAHERFEEDALRMLRAIRFCITKGFREDENIRECLFSMGWMLEKISIERIREELYKCFKHDTVKTMNMLSYYTPIRNMCFKRGLWLEPTLKS